MGARDLLTDCERKAIVSDCGRFRYWLRRCWSGIELAQPPLLFVMLNPSTADHQVDDATIRRCVTFAAVHGFNAIEVVNLFAFRATKPADLRAHGWPVGPENDRHILAAAKAAGGACVAWGAVGERNPAEDRVQVVMPLLRQAGRMPMCLQVTRSGYPQHPLYLPSSCRLRVFDESAVQDAMEGVA